MNELAALFMRPESELLTGIRRVAEAEGVPILRRDSASLLSVLTQLKKPGKRLEAGTAVGYSALLMSEAAPDAFIETVEIDPDTALRARENIERAGKSGSIRVILGDASEVFPSLSGSYDMIFLDSAKGQYIRLLPDVIRLLGRGGLLVADNCIFYGKVEEEPSQAPHKHRTIVANMRAFLSEISSDPRFCHTLLETGDGMLVAVFSGDTPSGSETACGERETDTTGGEPREDKK